MAARKWFKIVLGIFPALAGFVTEASGRPGDYHHHEEHRCPPESDLGRFFDRLAHHCPKTNSSAGKAPPSEKPSPSGPEKSPTSPAQSLPANK